MKRALALLGLLLTIPLSVYASGDSPAETLDALHRAGETEDFAAFKALLTDDAVILGHHGAGRLAGDDLREHLDGMLLSDSDWQYRSAQRNIRYSKDGGTAWFDETLDHNTLGSGWGSGVLVKTANGWKLSQYSFSVPAYQQAPSGTPGALNPAGTSVNPTGSAAMGTTTMDSATTQTADAKNDDAPQKKKNCRRMRHKTNKVSSC